MFGGRAWPNSALAHCRMFNEVEVSEHADVLYYMSSLISGKSR
jgi:hypothetical protein